MALAESVDDGGVGSCVITETVIEFLLLLEPFSRLVCGLYGDGNGEPRLCGQCGRASCSILNGLFLGGI